MNEPFGFKVMVGGFATWFMSLVQGINLTEVIGFVVLMIGLVIQVVSFYRNTKTDKRSIEADNRDKLQYDLQMKVLAKELAEIESRMKNDNK